ncbi:MAG TPA: hypothetical protein GXZ45_10245 [Propionibacterium sp.]|nr:hypothetical protein [Propionibacterium sp.]
MPIDQELIAALLKGHTERREEAQVLELLRRASAPTLDTVLREVDAAGLFRSIDNHWFGPQHRSDLRELLVERLGDLSIEAQANLAHGMQAGHTDRADEEAIAAIFHARQGVELTHLKNRINSRTDAHDLEGLVFGDIGDEAVRAGILEHIATQAAEVETGESKVLCDIDDTVICALHDRRYPRGTIYPGILALLDALDRGPDDDPFSTGDLTFVTARPGDAFGLIENHTRASLRRAGIATHSVLTGTLAALVTHDLMAGQKIANIDHYRQLFPEYRKLFIGDSGQGDVRVGELLLERFGEVVDIVVIHDVVGTPDDERARHAEQGIHFVDTYVGAARLMHERGLIAEAGLERVVTESRGALDDIDWDSDEQREAVVALIDRDAAGIDVHTTPTSTA